jgi:MHS family proline/betaine transporter-like MFS transporter
VSVRGFKPGIGGAVPAFMVEAFPRRLRCTALSFGQNLAQACFDGTVPIVAVALIGATGNASAPAVYLAAAGVVLFCVVLIASALPEDVAAEYQVGILQRA